MAGELSGVAAALAAVAAAAALGSDAVAVAVSGIAVAVAQHTLRPDHRPPDTGPDGGRGPAVGPHPGPDKARMMMGGGGHLAVPVAAARSVIGRLGRACKSSRDRPFATKREQTRSFG